LLVFRVEVEVGGYGLCLEEDVFVDCGVVHGCWLFVAICFEVDMFKKYSTCVA
jgi:hypothetical protein